MVKANILFMMAGGGVLFCGIWGVVKGFELVDEVTLLEDMPLSAISWVIMSVGIGIMATSGCGIYGGKKSFYKETKGNHKKGDEIDKRSIIMIYTFLMLAVIFVQLLMGIFVLQFDDGETINRVVEDKWFEEGDYARSRRENYQNYFHCCGWIDNKDSLASGYNTPCPIAIFDTNPTACRQATIEYLDKYFLPVAIFCMTVASIEAVATISSLYFLLGRKKKEDIEQWIQ